jgi:hypothetical protein
MDLSPELQQNIVCHMTAELLFWGDVKRVEPATSKDDDGGAHKGGSVSDKGLCNLRTIPDLPIAVEYCLINGWIRT